VKEHHSVLLLGMKGKEDCEIEENKLMLYLKDNSYL